MSRMTASEFKESIYQEDCHRIRPNMISVSVRTAKESEVAKYFSPRRWDINTIYYLVKKNWWQEGDKHVSSLTTLLTEYQCLKLHPEELRVCKTVESIRLPHVKSGYAPINF